MFVEKVTVMDGWMDGWMVMVMVILTLHVEVVIVLCVGTGSYASRTRCKFVPFSRNSNYVGTIARNVSSTPFSLSERASY